MHYCLLLYKDFAIPYTCFSVEIVHADKLSLDELKIKLYYPMLTLPEMTDNYY